MTYPYTTLKNEDQNNSPWVPRALTAVGLGALAFASGTLYRNSNSNDVVVATTTLVRGGGRCPFRCGSAFLEDVCTCGMHECEYEFKDCRNDRVCFKDAKKCFNMGSFLEFQHCADRLARFAHCLEERCPTETVKPSASPTSKPTPEPTSKPTPEPTSLPSSSPTVDVCPLDVHDSLKEMCTCAVTHCESEFDACSEKGKCEKKRNKCFKKGSVSWFRHCADRNLKEHFVDKQLEKCLKDKC